ncbi:MAG: hypothetical protein MK289_03195 [Trichodesmium sp. ALOHA_ZT_67]|nr:hypothetical protein [Trichodesmium sp. ALOHA_ZT_67]
MKPSTKSAYVLLNPSLSTIQYWQQFGDCIGQIGELTSPMANNLYRVNSNLSSIRLYHQYVESADLLPIFR